MQEPHAPGGIGGGEEPGAGRGGEGRHCPSRAGGRRGRKLPGGHHRDSIGCRLGRRARRAGGEEDPHRAGLVGHGEGRAAEESFDRDHAHPRRRGPKRFHLPGGCDVAHEIAAGRAVGREQHRLVAELRHAHEAGREAGVRLDRAAGGRGHRLVGEEIAADRDRLDPHAAGGIEGGDEPAAVERCEVDIDDRCVGHLRRLVEVAHEFHDRMVPVEAADDRAGVGDGRRSVGKSRGGRWQGGRIDEP